MTPRPVALVIGLTGVLSAAVFAQSQSTQATIATNNAAVEQAMTADLDQRVPGLGAAEALRVARGFRIAPVRLDLRGKNALLVGLGSYLVNGAGGCNDCHTDPNYAEGGDPFEGEPEQINAENYLAGGRAFGPFVSRNLTPDPQSGLPAGLTFRQFVETMRTGVDQKQLHPQISPLLQVMPWPVYKNLTDRDLRAIYEFLRAIPHAEPAAP